MVSVAVAFAGLVVLAYCAFRVFVAVRRLGGELERTRGRLEPRRQALRQELRRTRRTSG